MNVAGDEWAWFSDDMQSMLGKVATSASSYPS